MSTERCLFYIHCWDYRYSCVEMPCCMFAFLYLNVWKSQSPNRRSCRCCVICIYKWLLYSSLYHILFYQTCLFHLTLFYVCLVWIITVECERTLYSTCIFYKMKVISYYLWVIEYVLPISQLQSTLLAIVELWIVVFRCPISLRKICCSWRFYFVETNALVETNGVACALFG